MLTFNGPKLGYLLLLLLGLGVAVVPPTGAADLPASRLIVTVPGGVSNYGTDGDFVIWSTVPGTDPEIRAINRHSREQMTVVTGPGTYSNPAISAGVVVWMASPMRSSRIVTGNDINGRDLRTGRQFVVTETGAEELYPAISGDIVVWQSLEYIPAEGHRMFLKARNIRTMDPAFTLAVVPAGGVMGNIIIESNRVIWQETSSDARASWRIRMVTLDAREPITVVEGEEGTLTTYDFAGCIVAHSNQGVLTAYNFCTGARTPIARDANWPTTDGRYIFWGRYSDQTTNPDGVIFGYDLATNSRFVVASEPSQNGVPELQNGLLIWGGRSEPGNPTAIYGTSVRDVLPSARRNPPLTSSPELRYFSETGHNLAFGFKAFWEGSGGLPVFGYPLTEEYDEQTLDTRNMHPTQYFERQRYEYHPENHGTPYEVLLGRLGNEALLRADRDWQTFPKAASTAPHYFAQTGHAVAPQFWDYWRSHGLEFGDQGVTEREALALFGYPISEPQMEKNSSGDTVLTQWFERARFEYHPNDPEPYNVLLGRLAADLLTQRGW